MPPTGRKSNSSGTAFFDEGPTVIIAARMASCRARPTYAERKPPTTAPAGTTATSPARTLVVRNLQTRNLLVPVVGDFGGPKALRAVGKYAADRGMTVTAFYLSNVEQYLRQDGKYATFCASVAAMPLNTSSTFIRSTPSGGGFFSSLGAMRDETQRCATIPR
jgi:hypothetical protein